MSDNAEGSTSVTVATGAELVDTAVGPVLRLPAAGRISNADPTMYLECRQRQALSYLGAATPAGDLVKYAAIGRTADFHRHCVVQQQPRWNLVQPILAPEDLAALGFEVQWLGQEDLDLVPRLPGLVEAGQPVTFYAPAEDVSYWADLLRRRGRPDGGGRGRHNVLVCGVSVDGQWLLTPDSTDEGCEFRPEFLSVPRMRAAAEADPDHWFVDTLSLRRSGAPQADHFAERHRETVLGLQEGFEVYAALPDLLRSDRARRPDLDQQVASADVLRMLAGSRGMFHQFLRHTSHSREAVADYRRLAVLLAHLFTRAFGYLGGRGPEDLTTWRRDLTALRAAELTALRRLQDELAAGPVAVTVPTV